jgi:ABC-type uncharacterized transport system ATPase subunit
MVVNVNDKIRKFAAGQRKKVEACAADLIAEEMFPGSIWSSAGLG